MKINKNTTKYTNKEKHVRISRSYYSLLFDKNVNLRDEIHAKMPLKLILYYQKHCLLFNFETIRLNYWSKLISTETCWKLDFILEIWWPIWEATRFVPYQGDQVGICSWVLNKKLFVCRFLPPVSTLTHSPLNRP